MRDGHSWSGRERNRSFLNCGDGTFAEVSALTGLDFADDGRALAVVDWDHDGDLDVWLHNRTGPRLRLMRNRADLAEDPSSSLGLRLRGTTANRDGIGARVEVRLENREEHVFAETLHAGDGFLSQSSSWLHFGLGREPRIASVTVAWPGGARESFSGVAAGGRYLLVEGSGAAEKVPARASAVRLEPAELPEVRNETTPRAFLPHPVPMPRLRYAPLDDARSETDMREVHADGPRLVNLWASWCLPCRTELTELTERRPELESAGLEVLAISVDGLDPSKGTSAADARRALASLGFRGEAGLATPELLDRLDLLDEVIYDLDPPFGVPVSYLVDGRGRLAAAYRGPVDVDVLLGDIAALEGSPLDRHRRAAPLGGRWLELRPEPDLLAIGRVFADRHPGEAERYFRSALDRFARLAEDASSPAASRWYRGRISSTRFDLAVLARESGDEVGAIDHLREALPHAEDPVPVHLELGRALGRAGRPRDALPHFGAAFEADRESAEARIGLASTLLALGDVENAFGHLNAARHFDPENLEALLGMAWILLRHTDASDANATRDALEMAREGVERTGRRDARFLEALAAALGRAGRHDEAAVTADEALGVAESDGDEESAEQIRRLRDTRLRPGG